MSDSSNNQQPGSPPPSPPNNQQPGSPPSSPTNTSNKPVIDVSYTIISDISLNDSFISVCPDDPIILQPMPEIVHLSGSTSTTGTGYVIIDSSGTDASGSHIEQMTFDTTDPDKYDPQIHENLTQIIETYNDETQSSQSTVLLAQITSYAQQIQCSDFHGKGSIDDYTALFQAAGKIASDSKQMELNIDINGFNEFADAADQLSELFTGFILKLQNVNIISDISFLTAISAALAKIVNLSNVFGRFKQTILDTSVIQFPKSAHDTSVVIKGVMDEVNCAMQYINYFVSPTDASLPDAQLSVDEKNILAQSVATINTWNTLREHGVSIAMSNNVDVKYIQNTNIELKQKTVTLKNTISKLKSKLASFNIVC